MDSKESSINRAMAEQLEAERSSIRINGRRLSVDRLSKESGISYGTLRRILGGQLDVNIGDLAAMVAVINKYRRSPLSIPELSNAVIARAGGIEKINAEFGIEPLSEAPATNDELAERRRKQAEIKAMTPEQREGLDSAATTDPELGTDEPDPV